MIKQLCLAAAALLLLSGVAGRSCTTFVQESGRQIFLGRNLDWDWENGMVFINPRHIRKMAVVADVAEAARWTSKYGSVTFNQFGREMPFGGMNEAGLVIENMWLDGTTYPPPDARPEVNMLQWIQYQLDNCRTVAEVIATDRRIRLENTPVRARIHYLVCDATGDCATIEFINGAMKVHRGNDMPYHALANDTYSSEAAYFKAHPKAGMKPLAETDSMSRFCRAAVRAADFKPSQSAQKNVAYAFDTLDQVRQGSYTVWQIVYDVSDRRIFWRTRTNRSMRSLNLKALDFAPSEPVRCADIEANPSGSGELKFADWTPEGQRDYLENFFGEASLKRRVGDITWMIDPTLLMLRTYTAVQ